MKSIPAAALVLLLSGCAAYTGHPGPRGPAAGGPGPMARYDRQMQTMKEMHERMRAAKTPDERRALRAEHMQAMRGGMAMMCELGAAPGGGPLHERCMEMKDMTERMLLERESYGGGSN